ncbi:hypothetical protein QP157_15860 [Sphingomonas sp. LR61]|uniref:hypothetical protein n=1 Tax=Sphingomonas sp. LR61 TaxID=3050234 RepID=UPI002FE0C707
MIALLTEYEENKRRFVLADYRPAAINGGRFCEAAVRIIQYLGASEHTPLSSEIKVDRALTVIENDTTLSEALRLHVPRAIKVIYGVRNKRDTGHLKAGIDTTFQDAVMVVSILDWILAELVRECHGVTADEAQQLIDGIVSKEIPLVAVYNDRPVLLREVSNQDHLLILLYWANLESVTREQLRSWLPQRISQNLGRLLTAAEKVHLIHTDGIQVFLTPLGRTEVEARGLLRSA